MIYIANGTDFLMHHGVKGMRWGVRKFGFKSIGNGAGLRAKKGAINNLRRLKISGKIDRDRFFTGMAKPGHYKVKSWSSRNVRNGLGAPKGVSSIRKNSFAGTSPFHSKDFRIKSRPGHGAGNTVGISRVTDRARKQLQRTNNGRVPLSASFKKAPKMWKVGVGVGAAVTAGAAAYGGYKLYQRHKANKAKKGKKR